MPNTASSSAITMTEIRRWRQKPTNWSIIEQDSAPDHDLLARVNTGYDDDARPALEQRLYRAALEGPWRRGDEYRGAVIVHQQRRTRQDHTLLRWCLQQDAGEHVGLECLIGILEGDACLVAPRVRLHHARDEQHLAMQGLAGECIQSDLCRLVRLHLAHILLRD